MKMVWEWWTGGISDEDNAIRWWRGTLGQINAVLREALGDRVKLKRLGTEFPQGEAFIKTKLWGNFWSSSLFLTFEESEELIELFAEAIHERRVFERPSKIGWEFEDERTIEELEQSLRGAGWRINSILPETIEASIPIPEPNGKRRIALTKKEDKITIIMCSLSARVSLRLQEFIDQARKELEEVGLLKRG